MTEKSRQDIREPEPTIVPVRRPVATAPGSAVETAPSRLKPAVVGVVAVLALAGIVSVFVYLPSRVEQAEPEAVVEPAPVVVEAPPSQEPALSAEELAALRERAENLLAELLEQRQDLEALSAASWGDTTWSSYATAARLADDAFLAENLVEAVRQYESALAIGRDLLTRSANIVAEALAAAAVAIESGNAELAASQYALVLGIEPHNVEAQRGQQRAAVLPDVLAAMNRGDAADRAGELEPAATAYREALALDPAWSPARTALESVNSRIASARLDRLLDAAYAAIEAGRHEDAAGFFGEALALSPASAAARDGLAQAEQSLLLDAIGMAEVRARAFERTERWDQAIARYREALAADPTLSFAIEGLERAQRRADLDAKLQVLIDSPRLLLTDEVLEDGQRLLDEARAIGEPGPRHLAQIEQLARLVTLASTPIPIVLASDGLTEVTVYRVGDLGSFTEKEVALKPGDYIAVGRRRGYRDVRANFSVLPGVASEPVHVVCAEPI
jgi:tetratricopeptide (TPR) repeat protein